MIAAEVVAVDKVHVIIICPHCGKFHRHGSNGRIHEREYGSRVPHCTGEGASIDHEQYELITTASTIRKPVVSRQDLSAWQPEQKRRRAAILAQRRELEAAEADRRIWAAIRELSRRWDRLARWQIATTAGVSNHSVTLWLHRHGIRFVEGRYRAIQEHLAGPELTAIFGRAI